MSSTSTNATRLSLIARAQANDSRAWQDLVGLYSPLVAFWCRRQNLPEADINDTIQDVFFVVARSLGDFEARPDMQDKGGFRAWMWTITRNKIIDAIRRNQRLPEAKGGSTAARATRYVPDLPEKIDESDAEERTEYTNLLHRALEHVREEFQPKSFQAFWRTTIDGILVAQVAEELGITKATVRQHRSRILRRLRQQLGEME
ncbi:MAG: sigma-70 family RNA polymerase sigma factor [Planctomycetota bacterium]